MRHGWFLASCFVLALLLGACGGGDNATVTDETVSSSGSGDDEAAVFASDDGVVSIVVPSGAAATGFKGMVSAGDPSSLGIDMSDVESVLLVYELGPDGSKFDQPVTITFRISPDLGGFDPSVGLPLSIVLIEDGADTFEPLQDMRSSFDGDVLVIEGTTTHFSRAVVEVGAHGQITLTLNPTGDTKKDGAEFHAFIAKSRLHAEHDEGFSIGRVDYSTGGPIDIIGTNAAHRATMKCSDEGEDTIRALVYGELDSDHEDPVHRIAQVFTGYSTSFLGDVTLEVRCIADNTTASTMSSGPETSGDQTGGDSVPGSDLVSFSFDPNTYCVEMAAGIDSIIDGGAQLAQVWVSLFRDQASANNFEWDVTLNWEQFLGDESVESIFALPPNEVPDDANLEVTIDGANICFNATGLGVYEFVSFHSLVSFEGSAPSTGDSSLPVPTGDV